LTVDEEQIKGMYSSFDLATTQSEFRAELAKLESKMPDALFRKLKYLIELYLVEMENDYNFAARSEVGINEHSQFNFVQTYLFGSWFILLRLP
jgi:hypothetical protein